MTFGSLFAGIGGIDLGLEGAGMKCLWQVEIDPFCRKVLAKHWPNVRRYKDVRECGSRNLRTVDLICGGFPCQPHSFAGKRQGAADDRNLWPDFIRIITELRPQYILAENVPGIITTYLDQVLSDLEGEGYATTTFNIPACAFDASHRRQRIFIVAHRSSERCEERRRAITMGPEHSSPERGSEDMADSQRLRRGSGDVWRDGKQEDASRFADIRRGTSLNELRGWWTIEPDVGRVADGVPSRVDRLRGLGNAVVPQVAEWIGRKILVQNSEVSYIGD